MRRFRIALALPLLVLLAQQGAVLHELSHLYYAGQATGPQLRPDDQLPDNDSCPTCQSFSQVAHPATASVAAFIVPSAVHVPYSDPPPCLTGAEAPSPRSRGTPQARA